MNISITKLQQQLSSLLVFGILSVFMATAALAQVKSDYQIQQDFKQEVKNIKQKLDNTNKQAEAKKLVERVRELENNYSAYDELINKALYPDTFEEQITELENRTNLTKKRLARIEQQEQKLLVLSDRLASYNTRLTKLDNKTDSLQTIVQEASQSEEELNDELRRYRQSLQQRDELVLSFVDSVLMTYQNMDMAAIDDMENTSTSNRISAGESPLKLIRTIPSESIQRLEAESQMTAEDLLRMKNVHMEFSNMWKRVGHKFSEIYSVNPMQTESEIQQNINRWEQALKNRLWSSIHQSFEQADINLSEFNNPDAFYDALNTYVEQGLTQGKQDSGNNTYTSYKKFSEFWNSRVKAQWVDNMIRTDLLSSAQVATIDQKTNSWASIARPESNLYTYLFGVSILAVAVLGFMLFREKTNGSGGSGDKKSK